MGIKTLISNGKLKVWPDVMDPGQDGKSAPSLWEVALNIAPKIYGEPEEFFNRTYLTRPMNDMLQSVAARLEGKAESNVYMLVSRFGGGKTHTLITIYHAFTEPRSLKTIDAKLATQIGSLKNIKVIPLDADSEKLVPHPLRPYRHEGFTINTIWGMLAYRLGEYAKIEKLDTGEKPAPTVDLLRAILKDKKALILMDEIVKYVFNLQKSKETASYGSKVVTFIENLAKAVEDTDIVLIMAMQAEYKREGPEEILFPEKHYEDQANSIIRALRRVSPRTIVPVSSDDIGQVLKKRIFEIVPEDMAFKAESEMFATYRQHKELFGTEARWDFATSTKVFSIRETYPFHPKYLEVLSEFVNRNKDLQKTRDAVNITRKVVRNLLRTDTDPSLIMPWHIDLRSSDIRNNVITESFREFEAIINKDIVSREGYLGNVKYCSKPEIALATAISIILRTYTYETFKEALNVFPDLNDVALMVYEPYTFSETGVAPTEINDIIAEMLSRLDHFVSDKGRYWFTPFRSVKEIVDKMAEEILAESRMRLMTELTKILETIINPSEFKYKAAFQPIVFKQGNFESIQVKLGDTVGSTVDVPPGPKMKLVIFLKQPVEEEELENTILRFRGSRRDFVNTVVAVHPDPMKRLEDILIYMARLEAARQVHKNLKEYYSDEDVRRLQEKKLKDYMGENESLARDTLLSILTKVSYPFIGPSVKTIDALKSSSIVEQVERTLNSALAGYKIRDKITFGDLSSYLEKSSNIDLVNGDKPYDFNYIYQDLFLAKPDPPFVTKNQIESAILEGLRNLDIAIYQDNKLYWKKIGSPEAEEPESISEKAVIFPYRLAARQLVEKLLREEGRKKTSEGYILEIKYFVQILGEKRPLSQLASLEGFEDIIKGNIIVREETRIEKGFYLTLEPSYLSIKPKASAQVKFGVEAIGEYKEKVELQVNHGEIEPRVGTPNFEGNWKIEAELRPGTYRYKLSAIGADGSSRTQELVVNVESEYKIIEVDTIDMSKSGSCLLAVKPRSTSNFKLVTDTLNKLQIVGQARISLKIGEKIKFEAQGVVAEIVSFLTQRFEECIERYGTLLETPEYSGEIGLSEPVIIDARIISNLRPLNKKAIFVLQVKE
jgi:predicted AAA+ superfamily ATPase